MKKNISVNINGYLYHIDEDAYEKLLQYIERLKSHFKTHSGKDDIIQDIEDRISEMMRAKIAGGKNAISIEDVSEIIEIMGEPWQFEQEEETQSNTQSSEQKHEEYYSYQRRFYRDPDSKIVAGVASGIAAYFNLDPMWIRLVFVALFFMGPGFFAYIILWIVIPEAKTTAQKLEMKGEPINIENIEKTIKDEFQNLNEKVKDLKEKHKDNLNIFERIAQAFVKVFTALIRVAGIFIGIVLTIVAIVLITALIPSFLNTDGFFVLGSSDKLFFSLPNFLQLVFNTPSDVYLTLTALAIVVGMPLVGLIIQGIKMIFGIKRRNYFMGTTFLIVWLTGILLLVISGAKIADKFKTEANDRTIVECQKMKSDTLFLQIMPHKSLQENYIEEEQADFLYSNFLYLIDSNSFLGLPKIKINQGAEEFSILISKESQGKNYKQAKKFAQEIDFTYFYEDSLFRMSPLFSVEKAQKWRAQQMEITFNIPEGKYLKIVNDPLLNEELQIQLQSNSNSSFYFYPDGNDFGIRNTFRKKSNVIHID